MTLVDLVVESDLAVIGGDADTGQQGGQEPSDGRVFAPVHGFRPDPAGHRPAMAKNRSLAS